MHCFFIIIIFKPNLRCQLFAELANPILQKQKIWSHEIKILTKLARFIQLPNNK